LIVLKTEAIIEERIKFNNGQLELTGVLGYPAESEPQLGVLLCPPHPNFAGDMNNNVIQALARRLAGTAITLRFDYRGVGASHIELPAGVSTIDYWDTVEEKQDYKDAEADTQAAGDALREIAPIEPLITIGYSFGVVTAAHYAMNNTEVELLVGISPPWTRIDFSFLCDYHKPTLLVCSRNDFLYKQEEIDRIRRVISQSTKLEIINHSDHFFRGEEELICREIEKYIQQVFAQKGV